VSAVKIVCHRAMSVLVSTSGARSSVVAWRADSRSLVRMRQFFRWAKACSQAARSAASSLFACLFAVVSGLVQAA
jgi:hypothetical protein